MKIPGKMPGNLSIRGGPPIQTAGAAGFDYAIGGLPWLSAASPSLGQFYYGDRRIKRSTAQFRKQQFDNQQSPGEQSLDGYWIRSQMSFHGGAGQLYSDPGRDNPFSDVRFYRSKNVDPWTRGQLSLLNKTSTTGLTSAAELFSLVTTNGTGVVIVLQSDAISLVETDGTVNTKTDPSASPMRSVTSDGSSIFVASEDGLWKGAVPSTPSGAVSWAKIYTYASTAHLEVAWVKERIVLGVGQALYELSPSPAGPPAALPNAFYTAKPSAWSWTSISETSPAIYAVGSAGNVSSILKFTLDATGVLPVLTGGSVAATLPGGEKAVSIFGYLGQYVGIGTSRGARVGLTDDSGNITFGPLLFETSSDVADWTGRDRFLWCTYNETTDTEIKLARIDLSLQVETLRFAYATDLTAAGDSAASTAVAFFGDTDALAFATATNTYYEDETKRQTTGYLETSRIRFSTLEPKNFRSFRLRGPELDGQLGVSVIDNSGTETPVINFGVGQTPGTSDVTLPTGLLQDFMQLKFTLQSSGLTNDIGALMYGWQMKALPGSPRQRMIQLPLLCYDFEVDAHGQRVGGTYSAMSRVLALEALESQGGVTSFQDFNAGLSYDVYLEGIEFVEVDPPPGWSSWGGIVTVQLRTV